MSIIRRLVQDEIDNTEEADPRIIAKAVAAQIEAADLRGAIEELLPWLVRDVFRSNRNNTPDDETEPSAGPPRSSRWEQGAAHYQRLLSSRLSVGNEWKLLRDCQCSDLLAAADQRRRIAASNVAYAEKYEALAGRLVLLEAATVADLPPRVVVEVMR